MSIKMIIKTKSVPLVLYFNSATDDLQMKDQNQC